jgi:hypothetical protein
MLEDRSESSAFTKYLRNSILAESIADKTSVS